MLKIHESPYVDRVLAAAALHDAIDVYTRLFGVVLSSAKPAVADMLAQAAIQLAHARAEYRRLHMPARPYASHVTVAALMSERQRSTVAA